MSRMANERDFRKLAPATQAELRRVAVAMVKAGKMRIETAEAMGVNRRFVGRVGRRRCSAARRLWQAGGGVVA